MYKYIIRRLIQAIPTLFGVSLLSFIIMSAAPGGPTTALFFGNPELSEEEKDLIRERLGLNDPWHMQYIHWLIGDDWRPRSVVERDNLSGLLEAGTLQQIIIDLDEPRVVDFDFSPTRSLSDGTLDIVAPDGTGLLTATDAVNGVLLDQPGEYLLTLCSADGTNRGRYSLNVNTTLVTDITDENPVEVITPPAYEAVCANPGPDIEVLEPIRLDIGETVYGERLGIVRGDFGRSFTRAQRPVIDLIGEKIAATLELGASAFFVGLAFGLPIGILAAIGRGGIFDNVTRVAAVFFNAIPNFYLGLILILIFPLGLGVLEAAGRCPTPSDMDVMMGNTGCPPIYERLEFLILPTFTLGTVYIAIYSRYMRASMLDVIGQDYIRTARSKGLNNRMVWFKHGARNALIPIATFLGPAIVGLIGGSVVTEQVFSWPGLGRDTIAAINQQDYPFIMAVVMIGAVATILGYILSDILYALIDPRIRFR